MPARTEEVVPQAPQQFQVPPPPMAAPHSPTAQNQEEIDRNRRLQEKAKALREAPRAVPVTDVAVIIGMRTRENGRQETMIDINGSHRILECTQTVKEKVRAVTEDGQFLGYEPTGEYELTLKVKYLKE